MVVAAGQRERHGGAGRLPAPVGNLIAEGHVARGGTGGVELQIPAVIHGGDGDVRAIRSAHRRDAQHRTVGLLVVAQHVENLLRSHARAERIVHGLDLPRLRRTVLAEIMLVVGAVVVLLLLLRLLGLHLVPLDFDDLGGLLRIPHIAVDHVVEHHQTMVGAEHELRGGIDIFQRGKLCVLVVRRAHPDVIVGLLRPRGEHAAIGGHRLRGIALAGIRQLRDLFTTQIDHGDAPRRGNRHPASLPAIRGRRLQRRLTLQADIRAALRPEHLAGTGCDRRLADHGERFDIRGALDRRILAGRFLRSVDTEHRAVGRAIAVDDTVMRHRDTATRPQLHLRRIGGRIHGFHIIGGPDPHIARLDVDERRGVASDDGPHIRFDGGVAAFADGGGLDVAGLRTFGDHGGAIMLGHVEPGRSGGDARIGVPVAHVETGGLAVLERSDPHGAIVELHVTLRHRTDDDGPGDDAQQQQQHDDRRDPPATAGRQQLAQHRPESQLPFVRLRRLVLGVPMLAHRLALP